MKKRHDLFDCIFALTARFIPVWLLRKSLFACIVLCLSIMRLTLRDTETFEKTLRNKKRGQLRKTADGKQAPQCQCLTWNKCSAFFPKGGSRQADVTGQSLQAQRDCTHHAKLRMTQFLLQPEISHCYLVSRIKSMTCERQRPCRVYWDPCSICPWLFNMLKELWSWESKARLIICLQTQVNFDLPACSETTHECLSRYWFADTWGIQPCTQMNTQQSLYLRFSCCMSNMHDSKRRDDTNTHP